MKEAKKSLTGLTGLFHALGFGGLRPKEKRNLSGGKKRHLIGRAFFFRALGWGGLKPKEQKNKETEPRETKRQRHKDSDIEVIGEKERVTLGKTQRERERQNEGRRETKRDEGKHR